MILPVVLSMGFETWFLTLSGEAKFKLLEKSKKNDLVR